mgnify:CR=1 FL=1
MAEGLFAPERKRALPFLPRHIGIVTSPTGAVIRDILHRLADRFPRPVTIWPVRVQGEGAAEEVAAAIRGFNAMQGSARPDLLIVARGGGSIEDLWAFNEEPLARAIAACPIPVVSAVGHEVDVTISDLVADVRAPTPSAAAETVVPDGVALLAQLRRTPERLGHGLRRSAQRRRVAVADRLARLARAIERRLGPARQSLDMGSVALERGMKQRVERQRASLKGFAGRLEALSPLATLSRGYSVARTPDGRVLRHADDFGAGVRLVRST